MGAPLNFTPFRKEAYHLLMCIVLKLQTNFPLRLAVQLGEGYISYSSLVSEECFESDECLLLNGPNPFEGIQNRNNIN